MDGLKWYRLVATWHKWTTPDKLLTIAIVVAMVILFIAAISIGKATAHETHLADMVGKFCPVVASCTVQGIGMVIATDCEGNDGYPDTFWRIHKHYDLKHVALHVEPLTEYASRKLLIIHQLNN